MSILKKYHSLGLKHHELLDQVYKERHVIPTAETEKALSKLAEARILVFDEDGYFRLTYKEQRHYDDLYERNRSYKGMGDLGDAVKRIEALCLDMDDAARRGDDATLDDRSEEAESIMRELHHEIDEQITSFSLLMHNGYHEARTQDERRRRNDFYHGQAKKILDLIHVLISNMRSFFNGPHMSGLRRLYRKLIADHIERWSAQLSSIIDEMAQFLHRIKTIEARTKRYRMISHALSKVSRAELIEALDEADQSFLPAAGPRRIGFNPRARENETQMIETASKIDRSTLATQKRKERGSGTLVKNIEIKKVTLPYEDQLIQNLLDSVMHHGDPIRVSEWAEGHGYKDLSLMVIGVYDQLAAGHEHLSMTLLPEISGIYTHAIKDIIVNCEKRKAVA